MGSAPSKLFKRRKKNKGTTELEPELVDYDDQVSINYEKKI